MAKLKLNTEQKAGIRLFLQTNVKAIIEAEIKTYTETPLDEHNPRIYFFTTFSMGMGEFTKKHMEQHSFERLLRHSIAEFRKGEEERIMSEDDIERKLKLSSVGQSHLVGVLLFLPSQMVNLPKDEFEKYDPEFIKMIETNSKVNINDVRNFKDGIYKHIINESLVVQYTAYEHNELITHKVHSFDNEVFEIEYADIIDLDKTPALGITNIIKDWIEVE